MPQITFNISVEKLEKIKDSLAGLYPIPGIPDPNNPKLMIPQFTKSQWAKECVRRWIIKQVARWEQSQAQKAIGYIEDNELIT